MVGLSRAASAGACARTPATADRPHADSPCRPWSCGAWSCEAWSCEAWSCEAPKTFVPSRSTRDTCRWKPLPPSSLKGLAMKVASRPWWRAISWTADFSRNARSAASTSSEWSRLISNWPGANSWLPAVTRSPASRRCRSIVTSRPRGSPLRPTTYTFPGSSAYRRQAPSGPRSQTKNSSSGPTTARRPSSARRRETRRATSRGDSSAGAPSCPRASARHHAAPSSHGSGVSVARSGVTLMSGRPASRPPCTGTTSPIGVVWKTARQNASPWPAARSSSSSSTSRPRSTPIRSGYDTRTTSTPCSRSRATTSAGRAPAGAAVSLAMRAPDGRADGWTDRKGLDAVDEVRAHPADRPGRAQRRRQAGDELFHHDPQLEPRELVPQAEVRAALAERDVVDPPAQHVEPVGLGEHPLVAVGGGEPRHHLVAGSDRAPVQLHVAGRRPAEVVDRRGPPQELLDRRPDQGRILLQQGQLVGVLEQRVDRVRDRVPGGLVAGDDEQEEVRPEVVVRQRPAVLRHLVDEAAHEVAALAASAAGGELVAVGEHL